MTLESVDIDELKDISITVDGTQRIIKVGEDETNHFIIPNEKKMTRTQFMIVVKDGKYFIRDLGIVHPSKIKVDCVSSIQIQ